VALGALVHFTVKQQFIEEWNEHKSALAALHALAPRVTDDTFILIVDRRPDRGATPYNTHHEMSSYMLAVYNNWTIMGNTNRHVRFYDDGIESTYHGSPGEWFAPGTRGPLLTHGRERVTRIAYNRIVIFERDGISVRLLPEIQVTTADGQARVVKTNPHRIEAAPASTTRIWQHVARR
jgi:hypothetical protein